MSPSSKDCDLVAVVTGGGTGIGRATAVRLSSDGYAVAVLGRRREPLEATVKSIEARGGTAIACPTDVTVVSSIVASATIVMDEFGGPTAVVNCAGTPRFATLRELDMAQYDLVMATNLRGTVAVTKAFLEPMIARGGGAVVNVSSEVAARGSASATAYGASKSALNYLTQVWAVELAEHNIRVNAVAPGLTDTEEGIVPQQGMTRARFLDWMAERIPAGRPAAAEEVAAAIAFLLSRDAAYISGALLAVDGAISAT